MTTGESVSRSVYLSRKNRSVVNILRKPRPGSSDIDVDIVKWEGSHKFRKSIQNHRSSRKVSDITAYGLIANNLRVEVHVAISASDGVKNATHSANCIIELLLIGLKHSCEAFLLAIQKRCESIVFVNLVLPRGIDIFGALLVQRLNLKN
jgi:hypothetical protein